MTQIQHVKELITPILDRYMIKHAAIFGSVAKGISGFNSDVDLLIEPAESFTLFKMLSLENELSKVLNGKVDVVEYGAIKPSMKEDVLRTAISIL